MTRIAKLELNFEFSRLISWIRSRSNFLSKTSTDLRPNILYDKSIS